MADILVIPGGVVSMAERRLGTRGLRSASRMVLACRITTAIEKERMSC
jgi:hypothetical protein